MGKDISYVTKLTSELTDKDKKDFIYIFNSVFHKDYDVKWFDWKYTGNIYGDSYMVFAYCEDKPVGARAFWRNDIDGHICYQPCDTAVLKEFRGRGIFSKMTLVALDKTKGHFIYNYPNENSRPGYLKLGWKVNKYYYLKAVFDTKKLKSDCKYIEDDYLIWKFIKCPLNNNYYYCEKHGDSYLLYKRKDNIYYILGRFNSEYNKHFIEVKSPILFKYSTEESFSYKIFKNRAVIVSFGNESSYASEVDIPIFKGDYF